MIREIPQCIHVVIIFAFLDLEKNFSFSDSLLGERANKYSSKLKANETLRFPAPFFITRLVSLFSVRPELRALLYVGSKCDDIMLEHGRSMCR